MTKRIALLTSKFFFALFLLFSSTICVAEDQAYLDVMVQGVSCPFCIQVLIKNLSKIPDVASVKMSDEKMELVIAMVPGKKPNLPLINKTILSSGYLSLKTSESSVKTDTNMIKLTRNHIAIKSQSCNSCHNK